MDQGKKFFPNGCSYCGSFVEYVRKENGCYMYVCSSCGAYTYAHRKTKGDGRVGEPVGILADEELNAMHNYLKSLFNPLWAYRPGMKSKIDIIYPSIVLSFEDEEGDERVGEVLDFGGGIYVLRLSTGEEVRVPIEQVRKVHMRSKAYFWLSKEMELPYRETKIPMFDILKSESAKVVLKKANQINQDYENNS